MKCPLSTGTKNGMLTLGLPIVLTFINAREIGRVTGAQNESVYRAIIDALIEGKNAKVPIASFDRLLRIGAEILVGLVGYSTGNWFVLGLGGLIAFLGIYDRCPVWTILTNFIRWD